MADLRTLVAALSDDKRAQLRRLLDDSRAGIAVVGAGCRLPGGVDSPEAFWRLLDDGVDAIGPVPTDRWPLDTWYDPDPHAPGKMNSREGGFIGSVDTFDPEFFGISPREAVRMDPQQRILLEVTHRALEDANLSRSTLAGSSTGVFVGIYQSDYTFRQLADLSRLDAYTTSGMSHAIAANRVSYVYDLRGPSVAVDTACSSSLVATHLALRALRSGECDRAIVGGVNLMLSPIPGVTIAKWGMLAPDGRCKTFDARADGFVRGEGCAVLVLEREDRALSGGRRPYARMLGSATNQDGRTHVLTAPSGAAQSDVIRAALADANVASRDVGYVECHGTGTALGDPIEVEALANVIDAPRCVLGAVKTNIGHLEAASGVAGLLKAVLTMQRRQIPRNLHFTRANPHIDFDATRFVLPEQTIDWPEGPHRVAGVSGFGFGGANAHVVIGGYDEPTCTPDQSTDKPDKRSRSSGTGALATPTLTDGARQATPAEADGEREPNGGVRSAGAPPSIVLLSATSRDALTAQATAWAELDPAKSVADVAHTAATRRDHLDHRLAIVARSTPDLTDQLRRFTGGDDGPWSTGVRRRRGRLAFVFSGQGTQWAGALDADWLQPTLREVDAALRPLAGWSLEEKARSELDRTEVAQALIFTVQVALLRAFAELGITPGAVVGHSVGEIAAAHASGALDFDDAVSVVHHRGRLMQSTEGGGRMIAVAHSAAGMSDVAAINAPEATVLSVPTTDAEAVLDHWRERGIDARDLGVPYGFHSAVMEPILEPLGDALAALSPRDTHTPWFSTVTGRQQQRATAAYWRRNVRDPVRFADAITGLADDGVDTFIELGPHPVLGGAIRATADAAGFDVDVLASCRRGAGDFDAVLRAAGALYVGGRSLDFTRSSPGAPTSIPGYRWNRRRLWLDAEPTIGRGESLSPLLGRRIETPQDLLHEAEISTERPRFLEDHRIHDLRIMPAAAYLELIGTAAPEREVTQMSVREALVVDHEPRVMQARLRDDRFEIHARDGEDWRLYAEGGLRLASGLPETPDRAAIEARCSDTLDGATYYERGAQRGGTLGPRFRGIEQVWRGDHEALARVRHPPEAADEASDYRFHPALLDCALHLVYGARPGDDESILLPIRIDRAFIARAAPKAFWCHFTARPGGGADDAGGGTIAGDVTVFDDDGVIAVVEGAHYLASDAESLARSAKRPAPLYCRRWVDAGATQVASGPKRIVVHGAPGADDALCRALEALGHTALRGEADTASNDTGGPTGPTGDQRPSHGDETPSANVDVVVGIDPDTHAARDIDAVVGIDLDVHAAHDLARSLAGDGGPPLWLCRRADGVDAAPADGIARTLCLEHPQTFGGTVRLDSGDASWPAVAQLIGSPADLYAVGDDGVRVERLSRLRAGAPPKIRADGTYLVTGGRGGIGAHLVEWLRAEGAGLVITLGRSADLGEARGVRQVVGDVCGAYDVAGASAGVSLHGVIHGAGVIADAALAASTPEALDHVVTPKLVGAAHLGEATKDHPLDFFALLSSGAAVFGSPGQANYAAANAGLDALAATWRAAGVPATAVAFGPWRDTGMTAGLGETAERRWAAWGLRPMAPAAAVASFAAALGSGEAQVLVVDADWTALSSRADEAPPVLRSLIEASTGPATAALRGELTALAADRRTGHLTEAIARRVADVLALSTTPSPDHGFFELGMDSLTAIELKDELRRSLGVSDRELPATLLFDHPSASALAAHLVSDVLGLGGDDDELDELSEAELEQLLEEELAG